MLLRDPFEEYTYMLHEFIVNSILIILSITTIDIGIFESLALSFFYITSIYMYDTHIINFIYISF